MGMYFYLCVLAAIPQGAVRFWAGTQCFKLKVKAWVGYTVYLAVTFAAYFVKSYLLAANSNAILFSPLILLSVILIFNLLFEGNIWKKTLFQLFDHLIVDPAIEWGLHFIECALGYETVTTPYDFNKFIGMTVYFFLSIPAKYIMVKIWNKLNKTEDENSKLNPVFMIFPFSHVIVLILDQYQNFCSENMEGFDSRLFTAIYFFVLAVSNVIYLIFLSDIEKKKHLEREISALNYMRQIEEAHYSVIKEKQTEIAKIRHDIKNQLIVIKGLLKSGHSEEAAALIGGLETDINASKEKEYCSVPIINTILFEKEKSCVTEGIAFESDIDVYDTGCISQNHLCSIFSNLMDNAINECGRLSGEDKKIRITAAQKNGFISVRCENTAAERGHKIFKPSESKGCGLKILRDIANRYDGSFKCEINENKCLAEIIVNILDQKN